MRNVALCARVKLARGVVLRASRVCIMKLSEIVTKKIRVFELHVPYKSPHDIPVE